MWICIIVLYTYAHDIEHCVLAIYYKVRLDFSPGRVGISELVR